MAQTKWLVCGLVMVLAWPSWAAEPTEVAASQHLSISRGKDKPGKSTVFHPKKGGKKVDNPLDRFVLVRFDSETFGKDVRAAGLRLEPATFDSDEPMVFHVYAIHDGDPEDEQFEEKTYDPSAEGTVADMESSLMIDLRQVRLMGRFQASQGKTVEFSSAELVQLVRKDSNGTVTLVIIRETGGPENSTFKPRKSKSPPTLLVKMAE